MAIRDLNLAVGTVTVGQRYICRYRFTGGPPCGPDDGGFFNWVNPTFVNDGNGSTAATSPSGVMGGDLRIYLQADLGTPYVVSRFEFDYAVDQPTLFRYSNDATTWTDLTGTMTFPGGGSPTFTFTAPVTARYWQLGGQVIDSTASYEGRVFTWRIMGDDVAVATTDDETKAAYVVVVAPPAAWDVYAAADPNGPLLATIQNDTAPVEGATERSIRVALNETGSGQFKINRYSDVAAASILARGNIVKVRFPWTSDYVFAFVLEQGEFRLAASDEKGGEVLDFGGRGLLAYLGRGIMWDEAYSTGLDISDTWTEVWAKPFTDPSGIATLPGDTTYVYVIGRTSRKISKIRQSDRAIVAVSSALFANNAGGLSADPADATIFWALEAPWLNGSGSNTRIHKVSASTLAVLSTLDLGAATHLTDIRSDGTNIWTTNYSTDKIEKRSRTTGALITAYTISYLGTNQTNPNGISVNGSELAYWFDNGSTAGATRALIANSSAPTTILRKINTTAISSFGGNWTTESSQQYFYMVSTVHDRIWKYQLTAATPHDPVDGIWRLDEGTPGAILWRIIVELQHAARPQHPIPDLTYAFTATLDSGGDAWDANDGTTEFDARIGDNALPTAQRLIPYGLVERMSPYLVLGAYNAATYGTNRASATFVAGKVRFEKGVNIAPEIVRRDRETELHSNLLAGGRDNLYTTAELDDLGYTREGFISTDLESATALTGTAEAELDNERVVQERIALRVVAGDNAAAGLYRPFRDYDVGDIVRLHTGTGEHDYDELNVRIYAMTLEEGEAGDWGTIVLELGSAFLYTAPTTSSGEGTGVGGGSGGTTIVPASDPIVEGTDDTGATITRAVGRTIRSAGWSVYQEAAGTIRVVLGAAASLLGLADVDADDIANGQVIVWDAATGTFVPGNLPTIPAPGAGVTAALTFVIDGGGVAITAGVKGDIVVPFACTVTGWTLLADVAGSIVVDLWRDTFANAPPTIADTITAAAKPTIATATKAQSSTLTGWTTAIAAGDVLRINVDSASTLTRVTVALGVTRT